MMKTRLPYIAGKIEYGRGRAASVLGQEYDVRRLNEHTQGSISNNRPIFAQFPARIRRTMTKVALENATLDLLTFEFLCNNLKLEIGDVLNETGFRSDGGTFVVAQMRPTRETICPRTESWISISRATGTAGAASQQPAFGPKATAGYSGAWKANERMLYLVDGSYTFDPDPRLVNPQIAQVPAGVQPLNRVRDASQPKIPQPIFRAHYLIYVPLLPGVDLSEFDRLNFPNRDRYEIALIYYGEEGLIGNIIVAEKLAV